MRGAAASAAELRVTALPGFPLIEAGDDLGALTAEALSRAQLSLCDGDVLVFAQKIVSKAEGRRIALADVTPSPRAYSLATLVQKDARLVELILRESRRVVRAVPNILIVEHWLGMIMANAGIDQSNVADPQGAQCALLLPEDPDASAARLRERLAALTGYAPGVVISDSFGRPWRVGTVGVAIGCAGVGAVQDRRGEPDLFARPLRVTVVGHADELASAASLVMGQGNEGRPVVLIRGLCSVGISASVAAAAGNATALLRAPEQDLFR